MRLLAMTPTALVGDRFPALAPLATIRAVRTRGTPAVNPTAIASGASSATVDTAPGPTEESRPAPRKNTNGTRRGSPPANLTARCATRSSVPLTSAIENRSVTPTSVRNSDEGNPAVT